MKAPIALPFVISLFGFWAACSSPSGSSDKGASGGAHAGGQGSTEQAGSSPTGGGSVNSAAGKSAAGGSEATDSAGAAGAAGEAPVVISTLSLISADAHVIGRTGSALRFTVKGTKAAVDVSSVAVTFEDASGMPLKRFDANWDGVPDSADGRIVLDAPATMASFSATATVSDVADVSKLVKAKVHLVDASDAVTPDIEIDVVQQTVVQLGDACDPALVQNRCDVGQSCSGTPLQCTAGVAPVIVELKYLHAAGGPLILTRGTDPDDDMGTMHIELLNAANQPVTVDVNSNPTSTIDTAKAALSDQGSFFSLVQGGLGLDATATRVRVTPADLQGNTGMPLIANVAAVTLAGDGLACDARGFTSCIVGDVCSPGLPATAGKCTKAKAARSAQCAAAIKLDPAKGVSSAVGRIEGVSLWDPPSGCTNPENVGRPEGVVSLHLSAAAKTLTVTTRRPETTIDTVLSVLPGCPDDTTTALGCNDDDLSGGYASGLTLSNVPAGDYTLLIESGQLAGGVYGVDVKAE